MTTSPTGADRWLQIKTLFEQALEQAPEARADFVRASGADDSVRDEVLSLLVHADAPTSAAGVFIDAREFVLDAAAVLDSPAPAAERTGERLGAWEIVGTLGSGGMGDVFEAVRADGAFEGRAAIKVLKRGMDSAAVLARFAQERRALARLTHAHIARLYDAGMTADGLPYFVMERVDGVSIDSAVQGLSLEARLALFLQLADAVAYAHRNLLVHRDLKPTNVLVDRDGQVKLLDFGIAKALDPVEAASEATQGAQRPYTPRYASPEQVRGEPASTATDVYSLGVLLYQLLTGQRPYGRDAQSPAEAARAVLEEAPTRPSAALTEASARSELDPDWIKHRRRLAGDLDNMLLKALEKPIERRYASVDAFAADVRAYLDGRPVSAHAPDWRYLAGKFIARHRAPVAAGAAAVLALVIGAGTTAWQAHEARRARDLAQTRLDQTREVTRALVFRFGDAITHLPGGMRIKEDLLKESAQALERIEAAGAGDAALRGELAGVYARLAELQGNQTSVSLDQGEDALKNAQRALDLAAPVWAERRGDWRFALAVAVAHLTSAQQWRNRGEVKRALDVLEAGLARLDEALPLVADPASAAMLQAERASMLVAAGQFYDQATTFSLAQPAQALERFGQAEQVYRDLLARPELLDRLDAQGLPDEPKARWSAMNQLAVIQGAKALIWLRQDRLDDALREAEAAVASSRATVAADPLTTYWRDGLMTQANTLAVVQSRLGRWPEALGAAQLAWDTAAQLAAEHGAQSKWAVSRPILALQLGRALAGTGAHDRALALYTQTMPGWDAFAQGPGAANAKRRRALMQVYMARSQAALGRHAAARASALTAAAELDALAATGQPTRDLLIAQAQAAASLLELDAGAAAQWRSAALAAYAQADRLQALGPDDAALRRRLQNGGR